MWEAHERQHRFFHHNPRRYLSYILVHVSLSRLGEQDELTVAEDMPSPMGEGMVRVSGFAAPVNEIPARAEARDYIGDSMRYQVWRTRSRTIVSKKSLL